MAKANIMMMEMENGEKNWINTNNGELHRLDGPAIEDADGSKEWYRNGKLHRLDGPAQEYVSGKNYWWLNDEITSPWNVLVEASCLRNKKAFNNIIENYFNDVATKLPSFLKTKEDVLNYFAQN